MVEYTSHLLYHQQTKFRGILIGFSSCTSVCLSLFVDMIFSIHVLRNWCLWGGFLKMCTLISHLKMYTGNFPIDWIFFLQFTGFFQFFYLVVLRNKKYHLKNYKELWFKHWKCVVFNWNFVFPILIYNIKEL